MKKMIVASLAATLLLSPVAAYADSTPAQPAAAAQTVTFKLTADTTVQKADIKAFADLKALFAQPTVDVAKVKATYAATLQVKVQKLLPETDALIVSILDGAAKGSFTVSQAKQAVDKGLQGYFYAEISNLTKVVAKEALVAGNKAEAKVALEQAIELYAGSLQATAGKRDATFGTRMQEEIDTIIITELQKAVEKGDVLSYNVARQMFDKTLIKVFHLATLTYAKKVPELLKSTDPKADVKAALAEGYFFFLPIYNSLSGGHKASADAIKAAFESDPSKVNEAAIKDAFLVALTGKITNYADKVLKSDLKDKASKEKAVEAAMEGNMFLRAAEVQLKERLGAKAYDELTVRAQKYYEAVQAGNLNEATVQIFPVLKALSSLNGISFEVGSKTLSVKGKAVTIDVPSFIKNGRTLVPARALAEGLGGQIEAVKVGSQMKIVIQKDGSTVEFFIGKKEIYKDGKALDVAFDQPALIEKGRTFIPVRAVSQVFGQKVFYSNKAIVVIN